MSSPVGQNRGRGRDRGQDQGRGRGQGKGRGQAQGRDQDQGRGLGQGRDQDRGKGRVQAQGRVQNQDNVNRGNREGEIGFGVEGEMLDLNYKNVIPNIANLSINDFQIRRILLEMGVDNGMSGYSNKYGSNIAFNDTLLPSWTRRLHAKREPIIRLDMYNHIFIGNHNNKYQSNSVRLTDITFSGEYSSIKHDPVRIMSALNNIKNDAGMRHTKFEEPSTWEPKQMTGPEDNLVRIFYNEEGSNIHYNRFSIRNILDKSLRLFSGVYMKYDVSKGTYDPRLFYYRVPWHNADIALVDEFGRVAMENIPKDEDVSLKEKDTIHAVELIRIIQLQGRNVTEDEDVNIYRKGVEETTYKVYDVLYVKYSFGGIVTAK